MTKADLGMYSRGNGWDETSYDLVFDEETAELYILRSWNNWSPKGVDKGSENITLADLKNRNGEAYQKAVDIITASFPEKKP